MQPEVAMAPRCVECDDVRLPADTERWRLYLDADDEPVWLRPDCADREFGDR